jgi:hypothetical protein
MALADDLILVLHGDIEYGKLDTSVLAQLAIQSPASHRRRSAS